MYYQYISNTKSIILYYYLATLYNKLADLLYENNAPHFLIYPAHNYTCYKNLLLDFHPANYLYFHTKY